MRTFFWTTIFWLVVFGAGAAYLRIFDTTGMAQSLFPNENTTSDTCAVAVTGTVVTGSDTTSILNEINKKLDVVTTKIDAMTTTTVTTETTKPIVTSGETMTTTTTTESPTDIVSGTTVLTPTVDEKPAPTDKPTTPKKTNTGN